MEMSKFQAVEGMAIAGFSISAFLICVIGFPVTIRLSRAIGLVDMPTERKNHKHATPLVGGITFYLGFFIISALFAREWINLSMFVWLGIVLAIGIYDDIAELSAVNRLAAHAAIIVGIFATDGLAVFSVGDILGTGPVMFVTPVAVCLTVIAVLGAVNSVNMIDGADGLLGSLVTVSLFTLLMISLVAPSDEFIHKSFSTADIATMLGALVAFLLFNCRFFKLKQAVVFMGDAGSTAIGFCVVFLLIDFSQGNDPLISPVTAGWILGLPLLDASAVIGKRILSGNSPIKPGRDHIHHLFIDAGYSVNQTVGVLVLLHCLLVFIGVSAKLVVGVHADMFLFWLFVLCVFARILLTEPLNMFLKNSAKKVSKARYINI